MGRYQLTFQRQQPFIPVTYFESVDERTIGPYHFQQIAADLAPAGTITLDVQAILPDPWGALRAFTNYYRTSGLIAWRWFEEQQQVFRAQLFEDLYAGRLRP